MAQINKAEKDVAEALTKGCKGLPPETHITVKAGDLQTLCRLVLRAKFEPAPEPVDELDG